MKRRWLVGLMIGAACVSCASAQKKQIEWSEAEKPIYEQLRHLRDLPDDVRASTTKRMAEEIRVLPVTPNKLRLAEGLANLSTEGDFGRDALQEVANTLADALHEQPQADQDGQPAAPYVELAELARYEDIHTSLEAPQITAATAKLVADDKARQNADFTLTDLSGKQWTLKDLRGKVVLVNFWATWCPPCRKEMPDLDALYRQFRDSGFIVLAISDEDAGKVKPFLDAHPVSYPVLLDADRNVNKLFRVEGIPKSFVYDRGGKLCAQSIDMRTRKQFLAMLERAGLK